MLIYELKNRMKKKAMKIKRHPCRIQKYFIVAAGFSKKGNCLEIAINKPAEKPGNRYFHAEGILINKHGRKLDSIYIARFGNNGESLPIEPCCQCKAIADRLHIKIISLE